MFVADYFHRCGVPNPFGHAALDIKALYMGVTGEPWERTSFAAVAARFGLHPRPAPPRPGGRADPGRDLPPTDRRARGPAPHPPQGEADMTPEPVPQADLDRIVASARRLGVELDEADALQWLAAVAAAGGGEVVVDDAAGVFGHRVSMLDFSSEDLAHFRAIGAPGGLRRCPRGGDRPGPVGLGGAVEDPDLPRGLRLLRARQHPGPHPRRRLPAARRADAGEGPGHSHRGHLPAHRGQVRQLPARPGAGRVAPAGRARPSPGSPRRSSPGA